MKHRLFSRFPYLVGFVLLGSLIILRTRFDLDYYSIKGFKEVLSSMINFLSIIIGFYSAFYGMIITLSKSKFMEELRKSRYSNELPRLLLSSLIIAFATLIVTILMQVLVNYKSNVSLMLYFFWGLLTGAAVTYAFQTALLSISMIFYSSPQEKDTVKVDL